MIPNEAIRLIAWNHNDSHNLAMSDNTRTTPFPLRLPPELRESLERDATRNARSLNAEIVHRLQRSIEVSAQAGKLDPDDPLGGIEFALEGIGHFESAIRKAVKLARAKYNGVQEE